MDGCESSTIGNLSAEEFMVLNCGVGEDSCPLDSKEIKRVNPKGNQSWIFIGITELNWTERSKCFSTYFSLGSLCFLATSSVQFSSFHSLSCVQFFATPWTAACQASLSFTNSQSLLKLMFIESVMPSSHLILCRPLLLASIFPSIRVFSNESVLRIRWPKYWSFSFSIRPSNEYSGLIPLGWTGCIFLQSKGPLRVLSNTTVQDHQLFGSQLSL